MIDLTLFVRHIMPRATGAALPIVERAVIHAAQEFCRRSRLWRFEDTYRLNYGEDVAAVPYGAMLHEIEFAQWEHTPLEPIAWSRLSERYRDWERDTGQPRWLTQNEWGTFRVVPYAPGELKLSLILAPAEDADQLPDFLANFVTTVADGALGEVLMIPQQPYSQPELASYYTGRFQQKLDSLSSMSQRGQQRARPRVRAQWL